MCDRGIRIDIRDVDAHVEGVKGIVVAVRVKSRIRHSGICVLILLVNCMQIKN